MKNSDAIKILKMVEAHGILTKDAKELAIKALESVREWIPVKECLPMPETEVFILAKRKTQAYEDCVTTTAIYEDGRMPECYSCWNWEDIDGEWDEENDCHIIPKGWWEFRHYNPDGVYNNAIDDEVIAWMPLPLLPDYRIE